MKILMINRTLYSRSAAETAMFCLAGALERMGHEVTYFAQDHPRNENIPNAYVITRPDPSTMSRWERNQRLIYDEDVADCLMERISHDRPSLVIAWQINRSLTYATIKALDEAYIPVWVMLTDFTALCPARTMVCDHSRGLLDKLRTHPKGQTACDKCAKGNFLPCMLHRCYKGKLGPSILAARENIHLRRNKLYDYACGFLAPSEYHRQRFRQAQFTSKPILSVGFPLPPSVFVPAEINRGSFFLFVGTVARRKGVHTLLQALTLCVNDCRLVIAGDGPFRQDAENLAHDLGVTKRVTFVGTLQSKSLRQSMADCLAIVDPSECETVAPLSLLQAQAIGKPAVVSDYGVLPERVTDGKTGCVFTHGNAVSLAQKLDEIAFMSDADYTAMCAAAADHALTEHASEVYAQRVLEATGLL